MARLTVDLQRPGATDGVPDVADLPALQRALDAGIFEDDSREADSAYGLARILDGVERLVDSRA